MANAIINVGQTGGQVNISTAAAPATPAVGVVTLYAGTDKALHALNSDGTDITIAAGMTGPTGPQGQTGATGPAGSNATSPITKEQTNSLVSTGVGATAAAGANCAVVIGNNACVHSGASSSIVIGPGSCHYVYGGESVLIGQSVISSNINTIGIGTSVQSETQRGIAIGYTASTLCNNANGAIAIGMGAVAKGDSNCPGIAIGNAACTFRDGINIGSGGFSCASQSTVLGISSKSFPGATGTIVLGNSSNGGTGACNSVVIGNSAQTVSACSIVMGSGSCALQPNSIAIGKNATVISSLGAQTGKHVFIGTDITYINGYSDFGGSIFIGNTICSGGGGSTVVIGENSVGNNTSIVIGKGSCAQDVAVSIGSGSQVDGAYGIAIGSGARTTGSYSAFEAGIAIGKNSRSTGCKGSIALGDTACASNSCTIAIGLGATACHSAAVALGYGITTERTNTTHVNSLVAYGQAASKTNAIGSTGGSAAINWDNSNIQTLTLTSNITTLTKSNPIDGAVYTLFLTQGASGGYTVAWGADVEWAGGTGPTLSTAIGAVDAVSLVYIAGVTGYYGNANLNFS